MLRLLRGRARVALIAMALGVLMAVLSATAGRAADIELTALPGKDKASVITITGELRPGDKERFLNFALQTEKALVLLGGPGGNLLVGLDIGQAIRLRGYSTYVADNIQCASACALAWLGGAHRFMSRSALIGFHAAFDRTDPTNASGSANAIVGAYLNSLGLSQSAIIYITSASPVSMSWLTLQEANQYGIDVKELNLSSINGPAVVDPPLSVSPPTALQTPPNQASASASDERFMAVTSDQLTLRDLPSTKGRALFAVNNGARVSIMYDSANGWKRVKVISNGSTYFGYVNGRFLTSDIASITAPTVVTELPELPKPSFCGKENEPMEFVLCSNDEIAEQESAMEKSYFALLSQMGFNTDAIKVKQQKWIEERRSTCKVPDVGKMPTPISSSIISCVQAMTEKQKHDLRNGIF